MTSEIETGADMPTVGRISTLPSIRGYGKARISTTVSSSAKCSQFRFLLESTSKAKFTYQSRRYTWIAYQKGAIRRSTDADEGCHRRPGFSNPPTTCCTGASRANGIRWRLWILERGESFEARFCSEVRSRNCMMVPVDLDCVTRLKDSQELEVQA